MKTMKFNQIKPIVKTCLANNYPVLLLGDAGIGKSSFLKALADIDTSPVFIICVNQMADRADISGIRLMPTGRKNLDGTDEYAQRFFPHITALECIRYAEENPGHTPILFMDEINRAGSDITSYCLSLITERAIGDRKVPDNVRFVFAGNHNGNITALDEAALSRFAMYFVEPDLETFLEVNPNLHPNIKEVLTANPDTLCCRAIREAAEGEEENDDENDLDTLDQMFAQDQAFEQITTPRTITGLSEFLNGFDSTAVMDMARNETLKPVIEGFTGNTKFTSLLCQSIADKLMSGITQASPANVKPARYDIVKRCTSAQQMETLLVSMDASERVQILAYALCERADNRSLVRIACRGLQTTEQASINSIMQAISSGAMNPDNARAFKDSAAESPLAAMFANFIN